MFDDIGPNHRQGTALFYNSFISDPPPIGDPNRPPIARNRFWTAVHEMGHSFNLAHSWQKSLGAPFGSPWIPAHGRAGARSFMNYPYGVWRRGGVLRRLRYRFTDQELLFMRTPLNASCEWATPAGSTTMDSSSPAPCRPPLALEIRVNRPMPVFEFLEPVVVELKREHLGDAAGRRREHPHDARRHHHQP